MNINIKIEELETVVSKGQPFAKRNKEWRIRRILHEMRTLQARPWWIKFRDYLRASGVLPMRPRDGKPKGMPEGYRARGLRKRKEIPWKSMP